MWILGGFKMILDHMTSSSMAMSVAMFAGLFHKLGDLLAYNWGQWINGSWGYFMMEMNGFKVSLDCINLC